MMMRRRMSPLVFIAALLFAGSFLFEGATCDRREVVNFDFGFRHLLGGDSEDDLPGACANGTEGVNYGTGGLMIGAVSTPSECCAECDAASSYGCGCWDWNIETQECWIKRNCSAFEKNAERFSAMHSTRGQIPFMAKRTFDDTSWQIVNAPHDMLIVQKYDQTASKRQAFLPRGNGWYRKTFYLPSDWKDDSNVWMQIEGSFHQTYVYVNDQLAAFHDAGYTSFNVRLDNVSGIRFGQGVQNENLVSIFVNGDTGTGWWYEGAGLFRHLKLLRTDRVYLTDKTWVSPVVAGNSEVSAFVGVRNDGKAAKSFSGTIDVIDSGNGKRVGSASFQTSVIDAGGEFYGQIHVHVSGVKAWSVQQPHMHTVQFALAGDDTFDSLNISAGFRDVRFDPEQGLYVNDERVKLRGFCDHSTFGGVGSAVPDRINLFRAQALRAIGANSWR